MNTRFSLELFERVPIVGILRGLAAGQVPPVLQAVLEGGLTNLEVTMNSPGAADQIRQAVELAGPRMNVGAGTVTSLALLDEARQAGAAFIVTPTVCPEVIGRCVDLGLPVFPGALTPTEILQAWELGATAVKVFPADLFGPNYIRSVLAPLSGVRLMPTGGIDTTNLADYWKAGARCFGVGSPLFRPDRIAAEDWAWLVQQAARFVDALAGARAPG